ncbi:MAG TPA: hypothetical protein V6D10_07105 [Trichocoleus sp.]|jgi:hypothetical protein
MITPEEIRDTLQEALSNELGSYTFSGGQTTPAIRIEDGSNPYPEEPKVSGLEIVIQPSIDIPVKYVLDGYQQTFAHLIALKQWDIEKTALGYLDTVMDTIGQFAELKVDRVNRQMRLAGLDNIETLSFVVSETVLTWNEN